MNERLACSCGLQEAIAIAVGGGVYMAALAGIFVVAGPAFPPPPAVQLVGGLATFLAAPALVVLFAAIREVPGRSHGVLGTLGLSFILLFAAMVSINRFLQLTVVRMGSAPGSATDLARFMPYSTGSVTFALEMLGWGFFMSLAAFSVAPLFEGDGSRLQRWIRRLFLAFGALSLASVVGYAFNSAVVMAGFVAWGPILTAIGVEMAVFCWRRLR